MIRHAKSSWANPLQSDFDRPLNDRGKRDAPAMGKKLKKAGIIPNLVICSTAKRTEATAKYICNAVQYDMSNVQWEEKLYHCIPAVFEEVIYSVADDIGTVFIIAHNPGITEFVNQLSPGFYVSNLPTSGTVAVTFEADSWTQFSPAKKEVIFFEHPRNENDT